MRGLREINPYQLHHKAKKCLLMRTATKSMNTRLPKKSRARRKSKNIQEKSQKKGAIQEPVPNVKFPKEKVSDSETRRKKMILVEI